MGRTLILMGVTLIAIGLLWQFGSKLGLGKLPGDIQIRRGQTEFHFPIVTCLLISIGISLVAWIIRHLKG